MFKKLRTEILKILLGAKMKTYITEYDNIVKISAFEEFQNSDNSKHYRNIIIKIEEVVK